MKVFLFTLSVEKSDKIDIHIDNLSRLSDLVAFESCMEPNLHVLAITVMDHFTNSFLGR